MPNGQYVPMGEAYVPEVPVAPTGEAPSYVYDYATGEWVLTTPEEVAKREAYEEKYPGGIGGISPTGELYPGPERPEPFAISEFKDILFTVMGNEIDAGRITQAQAERGIQIATDYISERGLTIDTPYYKAVEQYKSAKIEAIGAAAYEKAQEEARRGTEREAVRARVRRESAPRDPDYLAKKADILVNPDFSYQKKYWELKDLTKQLQREYGLTDVVTEDLFQGANLEAFEQLPKDVQIGMQEGATREGIARAEAHRQWQMREPPTPAPAQPQYWSAFEAMGAGPQPWRRWFESNYSSLLAQYKLAFPEERPVKEEEKGWAEWLATKTPKLREEWGALSPYVRGERPGAFAPSIRTVRW